MISAASGFLLWIESVDDGSPDPNTRAARAGEKPNLSVQPRLSQSEQAKEDRAAALVRNLGGRAKTSEGQLVSVDLGSIPVTDSDLEQIHGLTNLEFLLLRRTNLTDCGMQYLQGMTGLRRLLLPGCP